MRLVNNHFRKGDVMVKKTILVGTAVRCAALAAVAIGFAAAAGAQTTDNAPKLVVRYSPASLDTDRGVRELYGRLVAAAEKVCVEPQVGRIPSEAAMACRRQAVIDAVAHIHNSRLADLSAQRSKIG
jgi:UrcA family protein